MCKCCRGYQRFVALYFLYPSINGDGVLLQLENDRDISRMCRIGLAHLDKDVYVYFEHIVDDYLNIVGGVPDEVMVNQTKDGVEDIDVDLNKDKEIERITNRIRNQFNDFVIEDAQSNGQKPLEEELLRIVRLFQ